MDRKRLALAVSCLMVAVACRREGTTPRDDGAAARRTASERAASERARSSATQAVTFTDAERRQFTRVELMIQSRFSGVQVVPQGRGFAIRIRGSGSFGAGNEPLVIIDGASRSTADLAGVDPREVDRIEVMKDGAAAIYGARGANGAIIITRLRPR